MCVLEMLIERLVGFSLAHLVWSVGRQEPVLQRESVIGQKVQILVSREEFAFLGSLVQLRRFEYGRVVRAARLDNADVTEFVIVTGHTQ